MQVSLVPDPPGLRRFIFRNWKVAMIGRWSNWKRFPDATNGEHVEAPIGPGVYEVCHAATGEQVAFGHAANVAEALSNLPGPANWRGWPFFRRAARSRYPVAELEYRTCAAGSAHEARLAAEQLLGRRQAVIRRFSQRV
jgi:hypothetical protein